MMAALTHGHKAVRGKAGNLVICLEHYDVFKGGFRGRVICANTDS